MVKTALTILLLGTVCLPVMAIVQQSKPEPTRVPLSALAGAADKLVARLDAVEAKASTEPELFRRHLRSVRALVRAEEARAAAYAGTSADLTAQSLELFQTMQRGFESDAANWRTYLEGRRSLILAYVSRRDHTLQHYTLTLPRDWKPEQSYPLYLERHGAGDPHPLGWPAGQVGLPQGVRAEDYHRPTMVPMVERNGVHVYPYGRGNSGYRDIGETDVWEALADAEQTVRLDPERYYLFGFSMGGGGTWRLAARTPDRWAAVAMLAPAAGSIRQDAAVGLGRNVKSLPTWIWCGQEDSLLPSAQQIRDELRRHGQEPIYTEVPKVGHNYLQEAQAEAMRFFDGKVRRRPSSFAFVSDTPEHTSAWGIRLVRDLSMSGAPSFSCRIEGQTVHLDSQGTPGLAVDLGALGLSGEVTLLWNDKQAYRGEVKPVTVGVVPEPRRR